MASPLKTFLKFSVGTWINALLSVVSIPFITWFLAPEELGKAAMFTLAYNLLLNILLLGQDQTYARHFNEVSEHLRRRLLTETLVPALCLTIFGVVLIEVLRFDISYLLFEEGQHAHFVDLLSVALIIGVINRFAHLRLRMQNRALLYSSLQILITFSNLLFTILYAAFIKSDFGAIIAGFVVANGICLAVTVWREIKLWTRALFTVPITQGRLREHLNYGLPFVPTFIFDWIFQSTDRTFLRLYSTFEEIGIYTTATRISSSLNILQSGFNTFWAPFVFERYSKNKNEVGFYELAFESVYIVFSIAILTIVLAKDLIYYLLPPDYHLTVHLFPLLLFVPMFYTLSEITGAGINLKKKTFYHFYILVATSFLSVMLGYFLIRLFGAKGAIISNFSSYFCFFILRTIVGEKLYPLHLNWKKFTVTFALVFLPVMYVFISPLSPSYPLVGFALICILAYHFNSIKGLGVRFLNMR